MKQSDKTLSSSSKLIKEMKKEFVLLKMNKNCEIREKLNIMSGVSIITFGCITNHSKT